MTTETSSTVFFDVLVMADMTRGGDCGLRIKQDISACHVLGFNVGLMHLPATKRGKCVSSDIQSCVRTGHAEVVPPDTRTKATLALVYSPGMLDGNYDLGGVQADTVVLIQDRTPDLQQMGSWFKFAMGPMVWAPTNRWVRAALEKLEMPVQLIEMDWRPASSPVLATKRQAAAHAPLVVGRVSVPGKAQWPSDADILNSTYPSLPNVEYRILGSPLAALVKEIDAPDAWTFFEPDQISVERFIGALDILLYFPGASVPELPDAAISAAMASGKIVVLPPHLRPHYGDGALYAEAQDALKTALHLFTDEEDLRQKRQAASQLSKIRFSHKAKEETLRALVPTKRRRRHSPTKRKKRALFVPSNGIGLGHVTRMLAIARRLPDSITPVFASMSQAASIIDQFGYQSEYLPSHKEIGVSMEKWDQWFRYELHRKIDQWDVDMVVYDGNHAFPGLIDAVNAHGRSPLVWIRRGMWGATTSPHLENARFTDLIIEPGEIAQLVDTGITASRREETSMVGPITLLDQTELLPRRDAKAALGLAPDAPSVLLQMGGGANRDVLALVDKIVHELKSFPNLQIVMAEWGNGLYDLPLWENTRILRGFPISKYFNAFDFSIAAAGYNTFHEVIEFQLPTIFMPNRDPAMDDQGGRADFAQDRGAGFVLPEDQMFHLKALCEALLNDAANSVVKQNCQALSHPNGARAAARMIAEVCA